MRKFDMMEDNNDEIKKRLEEDVKEFNRKLDVFAQKLRKMYQQPIQNP